MKHLFALLFTVLSFFGSTQVTINLEKSYAKQLERNTLDLKDLTHIYVNDDNSLELFYYALVPQNIQGTLVLFPPTWQKTETVINENIELIQKAHDKGLLVIVPSINYNLCLDETSMSFVNGVFSDVLKKYAPPADKFVFGGFSLGGMNAIRYTELAYENKTQTIVKPRAVYGVDPPLDWARMYRTFERIIEKNFSLPAMNEANDYIAKINREFGGSPDDFPDMFIKHSMYSRSEENGGNAQFLTSVPVRIYSDPDIDWHLKERRSSFYDINAVDQTAMINYLLLKGNDKAEYINCLGKGYRMDGRRHPHSWSLVDPNECIDWIMKCLK